MAYRRVSGWPSPGRHSSPRPGRKGRRTEEDIGPRDETDETEATEAPGNTATVAPWVASAHPLRRSVSCVLRGPSGGRYRVQGRRSPNWASGPRGGQV